MERQAYKLPDDFFFGAAMSGPQTEGHWRDGGKLENLWDTWSDLRIEDFHNRVGSYAGNDFTNRRHEDLVLLKSLGLTSVRTSADPWGVMRPMGRVAVGLGVPHHDPGA